MRVLLVEDTLIAQVIEKAQMTNHGCEVDVAADGYTALEKAKNNAYDLILMDIGLGDGPDGFEVTNHIKNECPLNKTTPIVAVTSHGGAEYKQRALQVGMEKYFNKPFTSEDAKKIIEYVKAKRKTNAKRLE